MKKVILLAGTLAAVVPTLAQVATTKAPVIQQIDQSAPHFTQVAHQIWEWAELGYQEQKSSKLLQEQLQQAGFTVQAGVADIPTAFVATYGSGKPVIGILAEFDALPGVSQEAVPYKQERQGVKAGHACGHHLFGAASTSAAIAIKDWLGKNKVSGTIKLYGCPAEEGGGGKVYLVRAGLFNEVDAVLHWHPGDDNSAVAGSSLANKTAKFRFYGQASHAAAAPERGRSALDAVEAMNFMVNLMREHVPQDARMHYVITRGGEAPNVVPAYAEAYHYVRHPQMEVVKDLFNRLVKAAEGAALGTGTTMQYEIIAGVYNLLPNETLGKIMHANLQAVGGVKYDAAETQFAEKIATTFGGKPVELSSAARIQPFAVVENGAGGSTDVGDVSWLVPTVGMSAATWVPGTAAHSWQAVAAGGMSIGGKGMVVAAKTLALTAIDLFLNPSLCATAKAELLQRRGSNFQYEALLGDRKPALDYRN